MEKISNLLYKAIAIILIAILIILSGTISNATSNHLKFSVTCDTDLSTVTRVGDKIVLHFKLEELYDLDNFGGTSMNVKYDSNLFNISIEGENNWEVYLSAPEDGGKISVPVSDIGGENFRSGNLFKITLTLKQNTENLDSKISFVNIGYGDFNTYYEDYSDIVFPLSGSPSSIMYGDVNKDGKIKSIDAILTLMISAELIDPTPDQIKRADVSGDGKVKSIDAILILMRTVYSDLVFPVEKQ